MGAAVDDKQGKRLSDGGRETERAGERAGWGQIGRETA